MNIQINLKRFGLYLKQYILLNAKMWGISALVSVGILILFYFMVSDLSNHEQSAICFFRDHTRITGILYHIGFWVTGLILTITSFNISSTKQSGLYYLMLPPSSFQKILAKWIIRNYCKKLKSR